MQSWNANVGSVAQRPKLLNIVYLEQCFPNTSQNFQALYVIYRKANHKDLTTDVLFTIHSQQKGFLKQIYKVQKSPVEQN